MNEQTDVNKWGKGKSQVKESELNPEGTGEALKGLR